MSKQLLHVCSFAAALGMAVMPQLAQGAEPTVDDCLAASDASLKLDGAHKLRAERVQLLICASASCPNEIRKECVRRVDDVNQAIPSIVFEAKDSAGRDLIAVKVTMDGELLADRLDGTALGIDPGEHKFVFEMAGQPPIEKQFVVRESQKNRHELITFEQSGAPQPPPTAVPALSPAPSAATTPTPVSPASSERSSSLGAQRVAALIVGGIGVVGVGIGSVFGIEAISKKSDANSVCSGATCSTQDGSSRWSDAKSAGNISTVAFIVGGVGLAGGAALWFTASPKSQEGPQIGLGPNGVQLKGSW